MSEYMDCLHGTKKGGRCGEVVVVEVRLCHSLI